MNAGLASQFFVVEDLRKSSASPSARSEAIKRPTTRVRFGDLWQLGRHRLLCGDSTDPAQVARLMQGERSTLTVTSPPYNLGKRTFPCKGKTRPPTKYLNYPDALPAKEYLRLLIASIENALCVSDVVIVNIQQLAGNKVTVVEFLHRFREHLIDIAIWDKKCTRPVLTRNVMNSRFEYLVFLTLHKNKGITSRAIPTADFRGTADNVYMGQGQRNNPYPHLHGATFPLHLPLWLLRTFDAAEGNVFDPFLGTGTTLMAAEQLERRCVGMEIEPRYCNLILARWEQATGEKAQRL